MPAVSELSTEQWEAVEQLAVAGMSYEEIGQRYDMEPVTIRVRAHRKKWAVPSRVQRLQKMLRDNRLQEQGKPTNPTGLVGNETEGNGAALMMAEDLEKQWGRTRSAVLRAVVPLIETSCEPENAVSFQPGNLKDLKTSVDIVATLTGQNKPQQAVQINVWQQSEERE